MSLYDLLVSIESNIFMRYSPDFDKLKKYGFKLSKGVYVIEKPFSKGEFFASVMVSKEGVVEGTVKESGTGEVFLPLRIDGVEGSFISNVRAGYEQILTDIRDNCFSMNYFISAQANRISDKIFGKFGDRPLFMWDDDPYSGVFKNPETAKWYGIIMYIPRSRLGEKSAASVQVMNLKLDVDEIQELLKRKGFYPAYHMNKKYWISLTLDEKLSDEEILSLIEESHCYTVSKSKKKC